MSEDHLRDETQERWRETLALLGLPPEPAPEATVSPDKPKPSTQEAKREATPAPLEPELEPTPRVHVREDKPPMGSPLEETPSEEILQAETAPAEPEEEPALAARHDREQGDSGRGRRRGRRGGRPPSHREDERASNRRQVEEARAEAGAVPALEEEAISNRDLREDDLEVESEEIAEDEEIDTSTDEPAREADEEPDTLSDWNVPSWQELIASLYRPDR